MYVYDPIYLEKRNINEWLEENEDNIIVIVEKTNLNFSDNYTETKSTNIKMFGYKKQYLIEPSYKDIYMKCVSNKKQLLVNETYKGQKYFNIGFYINKPILIKLPIKNNLLKNRILKLNISDKDEYISREFLELSNIELIPDYKINYIDKKNIPYKKEVYFETLLAKALYNYSYRWDIVINSYLRKGDDYFNSHSFTDTLNKYKDEYGDTKDNSIKAIKQKIKDLDKVFIEFASRHENNTIYYRGMTTNIENLSKKGDTTIVHNFISVSKSQKIAEKFKFKDKCCLYFIEIEKGVPYVDMINTTVFKNEKEILLPRNLLFELKYIDNNTHYVYVSINDPNQFKIKTGCKSFFNAEIKIFNLQQLKLIQKSNNNNKKECPPNKILNIKTNRCVNKNSSIGKKLLQNNNNEKECPPDKILNIKTNRCVNKNGSIGKKLLENK